MQSLKGFPVAVRQTAEMCLTRRTHENQSQQFQTPAPFKAHMNRKAFFYLGLLLLFVAGAYFGWLHWKTERARSAALQATRIEISGQVFVSGQPLDIRTTRTNSAELRQIIDIVFGTRNLSARKYSPGEQVLATALALHFNLYSGDRSVGTLRLLGLTKVIVNDEITWDAADGDVYDRLMPFLH